ncbi:MAG: nucleotidyltransferase family protein [Planctomycetota bacterium]
MVKITRFCPIFAKQLPDTNTLLVEACLWVHDAVEKITLHGSRGPQGGARPDSDMDLCLVVNSHTLDAAKDRDALLREALNTTLNGCRLHGHLQDPRWRCFRFSSRLQQDVPIDHDLAAIMFANYCIDSALSTDKLKVWRVSSSGTGWRMKGD